MLCKRDFWDALCLRYGWVPKGLPINCACGGKFSVDHAFTCLVGGFRTLMHNRITGIFGSYSKLAGLKNISFEPLLQALDGEKFHLKSAKTDDNVRLDLGVTGIWTPLRRAFFDTTVMYTEAPSYGSKSIPAILKHGERKKCREYKERCSKVENADFSPLVFTTNGAMGSQATFVLKRLCETIANKTNHILSKVVSHFRCRLSFALLRSSLICLRGTRSTKLAFEENDFDYSIHRLNVGHQ